MSEGKKTAGAAPPPRSLLASPERARYLKGESKTWPSLDLTPAQACDLELLLGGGYSPLTRYLNRSEVESVRKDGRLPDGTRWPLPLALEVPLRIGQLWPGATVALRDAEGVLLASLTIDDGWQDGERFLIGGTVEGVELPTHYNFKQERSTPAQLRKRLEGLGRERVISFQTDRAIHRADRELLVRTCEELQAGLVVQPIVTPQSVGDPEPYVRVRCCRKALKGWPGAPPVVSILPLPTSLQGAARTLLQALVARNFGCTHLLLDSAEDEGALNRLLEGSGVSVIVRRSAGGAALSDADLRTTLSAGRELPAEFTFPEVAEELRRGYPARHLRGLTVFFTGLSGSGKSTVANVLLAKLLERGGRPVTLLDGDLVRKNLSSELTFSKEHRDLNIRRIGYVASEITKHGGIALCCPIAPYDAVRKEVRGNVTRVGGFILVHMATPIEVCESRDRKGLYAKARAGLVKSFTGVSDPYELPPDAEVVLDTTSESPERCADRVLSYLETQGYLKADDGL